MDVIEAIKTRKSIRRFKKDEVPNESLRKIIDAARFAPSGDNAQPWAFIIIKDARIKQKIRVILRDRALRYIESFEGKKELEKYGPDMRLKRIEAIKSKHYQEHVSKAQILMATFGDTSSPYYIHDCCAATENLILAAHALGLGTCWVDHGIGDDLAESHIRNLLKVPVNYRIVSLVAIGFPAEMPKPRLKKEIDEIAFSNKYGKLGF